MTLKKHRIILIFMILSFCQLPSVYAMTPVKDWVNKIKPGTFETEDASSDEQIEKKMQKKYSKAEIQVLTALKAREIELKRKEVDYQRRAKELKLLAQQIEQKLDQMRGMSDDFEKKRNAQKELDEKKITRLVKYYESMDPELTAVFFNQMDQLTATHILMRMNPRKASAVWQLLDPKVSVAITEEVSGFKAAQEELQSR